MKYYTATIVERTFSGHLADNYRTNAGHLPDGFGCIMVMCKIAKQ